MVPWVLPPSFVLRLPHPKQLYYTLLPLIRPPPRSFTGKTLLPYPPALESRIYPDVSGYIRDISRCIQDISRCIRDTSRYIQIHPEYIQMYPDTSEYIRIHPGCIRIYPGYIRRYPEISGMYLYPDTSGFIWIYPGFQGWGVPTTIFVLLFQTELAKKPE
jgi:hypothetical protein